MKHVDYVSRITDKKRIIESQLFSQLGNGFGSGLIT